MMFEFTNGETAKEWLTVQERARLEGTAKGVNAATLRSIGGQMQDMFEAGLTDQVEAQMDRISKFPDSQAKEEVVVQGQTLLSRLRNQVTSAERAALDNWNIIENNLTRELHDAPRTNNRTWETAVNSQREVVYFDAFTRKGSNYAPDAVKALDRMFSLESPQFEQGLEILRTIDRIDPNRVRLLLQSKIITNSKMATTMFAVTAPGRTSLAQGRVTEVMTRAGAVTARGCLL